MFLKFLRYHGQVTLCLLHLPWCCGTSDSKRFYLPPLAVPCLLYFQRSTDSILTKGQNVRGPFSEIHKCLKICILCSQCFLSLINHCNKALETGLFEWQTLLTMCWLQAPDEGTRWSASGWGSFLVYRWLPSCWYRKGGGRGRWGEEGQRV